MWLLWRRDTSSESYASTAVTVTYKFEREELYDFYRQVCGVNLDAELYFGLETTPAWLRLWWWGWGHVPWVGEESEGVGSSLGAVGAAKGDLWEE